MNGLARLGWSHGNDEIFSPQQLVDWFNLESLTPSPARFDAEKFEWLNGEHVKRLPVEELATRLQPFLVAEGYELVAGPSALAVAELLRERAPTLKKMAEMARYCYIAPITSQMRVMMQLAAVTASVGTLLGQQDDRVAEAELAARHELAAIEQGAQTLALMVQHLTDANKPAIEWVKQQLSTVEWTKPALAAMLKEAQTKFSLKTPQVMMPLRILLTGSAQAPAVDALLLTLGRETSLARVAF